MILIALVTKLRVFGSAVGTLNTGEFITIILVGALLLVCAVAIRFHNNHPKNARGISAVQVGQQVFTEFAKSSEAMNKSHHDRVAQMNEVLEKERDSYLKVLEEQQKQLQ